MLETTEQTIEAEVVPSLSDIIKSTGDGLDENGQPKEVKEKKEPSKKKEAKTETGEELSEEELATAKSLFKALKDPDQALPVIDYLAKGAGYTKAEVKEIVKDLTEGTPAEKKEAKDEIVSLLSDQFGEEFAAKLAPAIKKAIEKGVAEKTEHIEKSFETQELSRLETQSLTALTSIADQFYGAGKEIPPAVATEMNKLMDTYKPSKDQSIQDYLSDIHALAAAKKGGSLKPVDTNKNERIEKNRNDLPSRLNTGRSPSPSKEESDIAPAKNLDEAIARAAEKIKEEQK